LIYWGRQQKYVTPPLDKNLVIGEQQKHVTHPTLIYWGRQQKYVTPPYIDTIGGQQKYVTHPTFNLMVGNKNTLPTLRLI
jgi:hypothetical protein